MWHGHTYHCWLSLGGLLLRWSKISLAHVGSNICGRSESFPKSRLSLGYWRPWPKLSFPYSADLKSFGVNGNRGAGSLQMLLAKTSCFLFKLWISLTNWNGLYGFGIRYELARLLPLQHFGGKNALPLGVSTANLEGTFQHGFPRLAVLSFGKCHPIYHLFPIAKLAGAWLVLDHDSRGKFQDCPTWFQRDQNMNILKATRAFQLCPGESFIFTNGETRLREEELWRGTHNIRIETKSRFSGSPPRSQNFKEFSDNKQIKNWPQTLTIFIKSSPQLCSFRFPLSFPHFLCLFIYS